MRSVIDHEEQAGLRAAILAYLLWGLFTIYWKQLADLDPFEMIGWRILSALVLLIVIDAATGRLPAVAAALRQPRQLARTAVSAVLLFGNWSSYVWAVVNGHVVETALGYFLSPLITMALGVVVLHERLSRVRQVAMLLGAAAVVVLAVAYGQMPWVAIVIAVSWSGYAFTKRGVTLGPLQSLTAELAVLAVPAIVLIVSGLFRSTGVPATATPRQWVLLLGTGVITALPLTLFAYAAKRVPLTILGPANYLVPIINLLLGWLVYGETMTPSRLAGFVLVWVALLLMTQEMVRDGHAGRSAARMVRS